MIIFQSSGTFMGTGTHCVQFPLGSHDIVALYSSPQPLDPLRPHLHPLWPWDANNDVQATCSLFMSKGQHKNHGSGDILFGNHGLLRQHVRPTKAHWPLCLQQLFHIPLATPLQSFCLSCPEWAIIIVSYSHSFKRGLTPYPNKFCIWPFHC